MSKYDIHKNKNLPSDEEIDKYKNFDKVMKKAALYDYKKATQPIYKNVKVLSIVAVIIAIGLIILFETTEQEEATEDLIEQTDSARIQKTQPVEDTSSTSTETINSARQQQVNNTASHEQSAVTSETTQSEIAEDDHTNHVLVSKNSSAEYKGGEDALKNYLVKNIKYPYNAVESPYSGNVTVDLVIEKTGKIGNFTIYDSPNSAISKEITRIVKIMPDWNAAIKNGTPIVSTVTVYFPFKYIGEY